MAFPTQATAQFTTTFDIVNKKFKFQDLNIGGAAVTDIKGVFKIIDPFGNTIYNNANFGTPDIDGSVDATLKNSIIDILIPLNPDGTIPFGTYTITYREQITGNTPFEITKINSYNFQYVAPKVSINQVVNCLLPLFTSTDETNYNVAGITPTITRLHTINFPYLDDNNPIIPALQSTAITINPPNFYSGTNTSDITSVLVYSFGDGLIINDTIKGQKEILVDCSFICGINCCLNSIYNRKENARCSNITEYEKENKLFIDVMSDAMLAMFNIDCGKTAFTNRILANLKIKANCTDDCGCSDGKPKLVTGLGGGTVNVAQDFVSDTPTILLPPVHIGNTWHFAISPAIFDAILGSFNSIVEAGAGISIPPPVLNIDGSKTYTVTNTNLPQNRYEFIAYITYSAGVPIIVCDNLLTSGANMVSGNVAGSPIKIVNGIPRDNFSNAEMLVVNNAQIAPQGNNEQTLKNRFTLQYFQVATSDDFKVTYSIEQIDNTIPINSLELLLSKPYLDGSPATYKIDFSLVVNGLVPANNFFKDVDFNGKTFLITFKISE